jgi:hypothetical protein
MPSRSARAGQPDLDRARLLADLERRLRRCGGPAGHGPVLDPEDAAVPRQVRRPSASSPSDSGPDMWLHRSASTRTLPSVRIATTGTSPSSRRTGFPSGRLAESIRHCQSGSTRCGTASAWLAPPASRNEMWPPSSPLAATAASPASRSRRAARGRGDSRDGPRAAPRPRRRRDGSPAQGVKSVACRVALSTAAAAKPACARRAGVE